MKVRLPALLLGAGGLAWLLGQAILPDMGLETPERYDAVVAATGREAWSAALLTLAGCLLVLGSLAVARAMVDVRGRGSRLITLGTAMLALGGVWLVAGRAAFNMTFLRVTHDEVPRDVAIAMLDNGGGAEFIPLVLTLPCLLLGPLLIAVGLRRAGLAGWLPLATWVVAISIFLASEFTSKAGEITGISFAALALTLIGSAVPRRRPSTNSVATLNLAAENAAPSGRPPA